MKQSESVGLYCVTKRGSHRRRSAALVFTFVVDTTTIVADRCATWARSVVLGHRHRDRPCKDDGAADKFLSVGWGQRLRIFLGHASLDHDRDRRCATRCRAGHVGTGSLLRAVLCCKVEWTSTTRSGEHCGRARSWTTTSTSTAVVSSRQRVWTPDTCGAGDDFLRCTSGARGGVRHRACCLWARRARRFGRFTGACAEPKSGMYKMPGGRSALAVRRSGQSVRVVVHRPASFCASPRLQRPPPTPVSRARPRVALSLSPPP